MTDSQLRSPHPPIQALPARVPFPAPPWRLGGSMWAGVFRTQAPIEAPPGARPVFGRCRLAVILCRYTAGPLRYDELILGVPVYRKLRVGIWVRDIWVSDEAALWGGREIWHLPKLPAEFAWTENAVTVADQQGVVASIRLRRRSTWLPWAWLVVRMFGSLGERWTPALATWRGTLGGSGIMECQFSSRFSEQPTGGPQWGIGSDRFQMTVHGPA